MIRLLIGAIFGIAWVFIPRRPMPTVERLKAAFMSEEMPMGEFVVAKNDLDEEQVKTWEPGPFCECDKIECRRHLPPEAWLYLTAGQSVVLPSHTTKGARQVPMDGFVVEEYDE